MASIRKITEPKYELLLSQEELDVLWFILMECISGPIGGPREQASHIGNAASQFASHDARSRFSARTVDGDSRGVILLERVSHGR